MSIVPDALTILQFVRIWSRVDSMYRGRVGSVIRNSNENLLASFFMSTTPWDLFLLKSPPITKVALSMLFKFDSKSVRVVYMISRMPVGGRYTLIIYMGLVHFLVILTV